MDAGVSFRRYQWGRARRALIPNTMPLEIVRLRVQRAAQLGLDYKTYASVRAATGRDVIAFLFSSNALRVLTRPELPEDRRAKLAALTGAARIAMVHRPLTPGVVAAANPVIDLAATAPGLAQSWSETRKGLAATLRAAGHPSDGVLIIGDTALEREWCAAANAAGYLPADRYFAGA